MMRKGLRDARVAVKGIGVGRLVCCTSPYCMGSSTKYVHNFLVFLALYRQAMGAVKIGQIYFMARYRKRQPKEALISVYWCKPAVVVSGVVSSVSC